MGNWYNDKFTNENLRCCTVNVVKHFLFKKRDMTEKEKLEEEIFRLELLKMQIQMEYIRMERERLEIMHRLAWENLMRPLYSMPSFYAPPFWPIL
jgi:hypothetical protein